MPPKNVRLPGFNRCWVLLSFFWCSLVLAGSTVTFAQVFTPPGECPTVMPVAEVESGMQAVGWTVVQGNTPEPFSLEILGVLTDGIALGHDMIIVEVGDVPGGTMIARSGGIWAGMSGSPVYVDDRLLGAVSFTFSLGPSRVGGVTPAEDMLRVLSFDEPPETSTAKTTVTIPAALRPFLAARTGLAETQVGVLESLRLPFAMSGLSADGRRLVQEGLDRAGISAVVTPSSRAARETGAISARPVPGGNFAGLFALGDVSGGGVGTATYVCGDRALAFGHPLRLQGAVRFSANDAEAITIVPDPTTGPFKMANLGSAFGVLDQDRTAAIAAKLGKRPRLVRIRSIVEAPDLGRSRTGVSWTPSSQFVPDVAPIHLLSNLETVLDEQGDGRSRVQWRVKGTRADGDDWFLRFGNRYASRSHISFASIVELLNQLAAIERNTFEDVTFRRVKLRAKVWTDFQVYQIESFTITRDDEPVSNTDAVDIRPGDVLVLHVTLRSEDGTLSFVDLPLQVPAGALGSAIVSVFGGGNGPDVSDDPDDDAVCLFNHDECQDDGADSFQELLDDLADEPRNDDLRATLVPSASSDEVHGSSTSRRVSRVVEGFAQTFIEVVPPTLPVSSSTTVPEQ